MVNMKPIITIDVGGTTIKHALFNESNQTLTNKSAVDTPKNLATFYAVIEKIVRKYDRTKIAGVALSIPGAVNQQTGIIGGISALPYIHNFPIKAALEKRLNLPVSMENDANCAALAEVNSGMAVNMQNIVMLVIGTGVGGAVVINRQLVHGQHLLGGEFGMMLGQTDQRLSLVGTAVRMAQHYNQAYKTNYTGKEILQMAQDGDVTAQKYALKLYDNLARAIFNLQFVVDPEAFIIGGGVSGNQDFINNLNDAAQRLVQRVADIKLVPKIIPAYYHNDANLIGAALNFKIKKTVLI